MVNKENYDNHNFNQAVQSGRWVILDARVNHHNFNYFPLAFREDLIISTAPTSAPKTQTPSIDVEDAV